ncbi:MAG: aminoacyl--tRNA ligase-related protein [Candidatus Paceibacterota bacterium]|jgi:prolyl-tRNA synthetase
MRQSQLFTKTRFEAPKDEVAKNAEILIRAGFIHKEMAGVYAYLPLGLRVIEKIKKIIREEMEAIGGQEIIMTSLQRKELWEKTDRWSDEKVDVWFKSKFKNETEVGFGWSHEEPITDMMKNFVASFRDLPVFVYQFQMKLRNELRAKSGIMRGREFLMKDLYSYSLDEKTHQKFYDNVIKAYFNVFKRAGIGNDTFITFASGGAFTQFSHEFQTVSEAGEDVIYINREKNIALNEEVMNDESLAKLGVKREELEKVKTIEVGNIFNFGTKKCEELDLFYTDATGKKIPVFLGSYGIGVTRLMGTIVEVFGKEGSMVWPEEVSPFKVHLVELSQGDEVIKKAAEDFYKELTSKGIEVLFDDREARAGEKFADADLIGIPHRVVISKKTEVAGEVEYSNRATGVTEKVSKEKFLATFS